MALRNAFADLATDDSLKAVKTSVDALKDSQINASQKTKLIDTAGTNVASVSAAGALSVDGSAVTQPISAASLPLPSGASTSANQNTGNTSLSSIDTKLSSQATAARQDTGNTSLSSIDTKLTSQATAAKQPALGTAGTASTEVITIQGIAAMTKLLVTPDSVALPANQSVNVAQINGITPLMGNGVTGTGSQRVTIASDNSALTVNAHAVTVASGGVASGAIASGAVASGAIASGAVASGALASGSIVAGAVAAGATSFVKLEDVASADADAGVPSLAVRKAAPANTSGTDGDYEFLQISAGRLWASTNVDQINGITPLMGAGNTGTGSLRATVATDNAAIPTWGHGATGAAVPANTTYKGLLARTSNPTAATTGNLVGALADKLGKQVVVGSIRDLKGVQRTTITSSVAETTIVTAVASTFLDLYGLVIANTSATASNVTIKDATAGTTRFIIVVPAGETRGFMSSESAAHNQAAVNNNWTATCGTSVASIEVTAMFVQNI